MNAAIKSCGNTEKYKAEGNYKMMSLNHADLKLNCICFQFLPELHI